MSFNLVIFENTTQCLPLGFLVAIDVYYREPSFSLSNLDELRRWIELLSGEVKNRPMIRHVAYFVKNSLKVIILAYIARSIPNMYHRLIWVFKDWLLTQWNMEIILYLLSYNVIGQFNFRAWTRA